MSMSIDVESSMDTVRESLTAALEAENSRYDAAREALDGEHREIVGHIEAALDALDRDVVEVVGSNGHSPGAAAPAPDDEPGPPAPPVEPGDELVDFSAMTMEDACLTIMATRPGEVWRAEELQRLLSAGGFQGIGGVEPKLASIRSCLSLAYRNSKLSRRGPGEYILPKTAAAR